MNFSDVEKACEKTGSGDTATYRFPDATRAQVLETITGDWDHAHSLEKWEKIAKWIDGLADSCTNKTALKAKVAKKIAQRLERGGNTKLSDLAPKWLKEIISGTSMK
jgi:hypothetical protein